jgi:hypothetical protein
VILLLKVALIVYFLKLAPSTSVLLKAVSYSVVMSVVALFLGVDFLGLLIGALVRFAGAFVVFFVIDYFEDNFIPWLLSVAVGSFVLLFFV